MRAHAEVARPPVYRPLVPSSASPPFSIHACLPPLLQVEDALVAAQPSDEEQDEEEEGQHEQAPPAKAARTATRSNPHSTASRPAAPPRVTAASLSMLLAGAPRLVDLLIEEDCIRCITLVCRDCAQPAEGGGGRRGAGAGVGRSGHQHQVGGRVCRLGLSG